MATYGDLTPAQQAAYNAYPTSQKGAYLDSIKSAADLMKEATAKGAAAGAGANAALGGVSTGVQKPGGYPPGGGGGTGTATTNTPATIAPPSLTGLQGATSAPVAQVGPLDTSAAQGAAFGRAKDTVGQVAGGALTGLRSALAGRGMLGSGAESRGTSAVVNRGQGELGDVARQQAIESSGLAERQGTVNFQGGIAQRGQDISAQQAREAQAAETARAGYSGAIAQRGQDIQAQQDAAQRNQQLALQTAAQRAQALQGLLGALSGGGSY